MLPWSALRRPCCAVGEARWHARDALAILSRGGGVAGVGCKHAATDEVQGQRVCRACRDGELVREVGRGGDEARVHDRGCDVCHGAVAIVGGAKGRARGFGLPDSAAVICIPLGRIWVRPSMRYGQMSDTTVDSALATTCDHRDAARPAARTLP